MFQCEEANLQKLVMVTCIYHCFLTFCTLQHKWLRYVCHHSSPPKYIIQPIKNGWSNLKHQITRTREKQIWKYWFPLYPNDTLLHLWMCVPHQASATSECHLVTYSHQLLCFFFQNKVIFTLVARHRSIYLVIKPLYLYQGIKSYQKITENSYYRGIIKKAQEMGNMAKKRFLCKPRQSDIKALLILLWISTD